MLDELINSKHLHDMTMENLYLFNRKNVTFLEIT